MYMSKRTHCDMDPCDCCLQSPWVSAEKRTTCCSQLFSLFTCASPAGGRGHLQQDRTVILFSLDLYSASFKGRIHGENNDIC